MKAIIKIDVPEYQIGQEVNIYFKDTMMIKGVVQEPKTDILDKIRNEIEKQEKWLLQAGYNTYNVDIAFDSIKSVLAESEDKE